MRRFVFKFDSLLRLRCNRRDLCRQLLAKLLDDQRALDIQRDEFEQERHAQLDQLKVLGQQGHMDIDRSAARRYYAGQLLSDIAFVRRNRDLLDGQLDLCRETLTRAEGEVKVLENLKEKQRTAFLYEQERQAAKELEQAWQATQLAGESL